jgi:hypothetical protein
MMSSDQSPLEERVSSIVQELAYHLLTQSNPKLEYGFRLGEKTLLVRMEVGYLLSKDMETMYVSLNPPGEACGCCGGSGKQPATVRAGNMGGLGSI